MNFRWWSSQRPSNFTCWMSRRVRRLRSRYISDHCCYYDIFRCLTPPIKILIYSRVWKWQIESYTRHIYIWIIQDTRICGLCNGRITYIRHYPCLGFHIHINATRKIKIHRFEIIRASTMRCIWFTPYATAIFYTSICIHLHVSYNWAI